MNILYVSNTTCQGGATIALYNIVKPMVLKGHKVYVLTNNGPGPLNQYMIEAGATLLYAPVSDTVYEPPHGLFKTVWRFFRKAYGWHKSRQLINKYIQDYSIDIVHTNVGPLNLALSACIKNNIPHVWHQREFFDKCDGVSFYPYNKKFYKIIRKKGNYNICITKQIRDYLNLDDNTPVIYDGVFHELELKKIKPSSKENYILFVGRFEENKGLDSLLYVWSAFHKQHSEFKLKIAGAINPDSDYYKKCISIIRKNEISDSVEILGLRSDVYSLMALAKALVVTSHFEGFGFITVEAMLNKTLTICRDVTGPKEQLDNGIKWTGGEIGLRFITDNELLDCLEKAVTEDYSDYIMRAHQAISHYTIEKNVEQIETYYEQIISECYPQKIPTI